MPRERGWKTLVFTGRTPGAGRAHLWHAIHAPHRRSDRARPSRLPLQALPPRSRGRKPRWRTRGAASRGLTERPGGALIRADEALRARFRAGASGERGVTIDLAVVGGGISGLSLAWGAARAGQRVVVLEREARVGGCFDTRPADDGFWVELGAHTLYRSYQAIWALVSGGGLGGKVAARAAVPFRAFAGDAVRPVLAGLRPLALAAHLPRALWVRRPGRTVRAYFSAVCGAGNYDAVLRHAFAAVFSQDLDDAPADLVLKRRRAAAAPGPRPPRHYTLDGGLATLPSGLAAAVEVRCGAEVREVRRAGGAFRLQLDAGPALEARALALACPVDDARRLLAPLAPAAAAALEGVARSPVESEAVVLDRDACALPAIAGLAGRGAPFFSVVSRDVIPHPRRRGFTFHFRPGVPEREREAVMARVLGQPPGAWRARFRRRSALPAFRGDHAARIRALDAALDGQPILVTGNYLGGAAIEDCAGRSRAELARWERQAFGGG